MIPVGHFQLRILCDSTVLWFLRSAALAVPTQVTQGCAPGLPPPQVLTLLTSAKSSALLAAPRGRFKMWIKLLQNHPVLHHLVWNPARWLLSLASLGSLKLIKICAAYFL